MWFTFEQALRRKCEQNPDLSLLLSQWDYDRRLVSNALQAVVRYFPHFSRHDASHSNTILVQVARILGPKRIDALSATDLWLLLEAAYQHDIGMVVTDEQVRTWWGTPGFKDFLSQLRNHSDPELRRAAELFAEDAPSEGSARDWPIEVSRVLTLAIAEYARQQHATNANRIILDPERTIGLQSPRTHLIPARLFRLLGKICAHHGRSFEDTMELPREEAGLGTDDAHPLFVACMLRLGDLLDLDNGRFCPVMTRSFGTLPASSRVHYEKHAAINHFQVSRTIIEVEAECESYESYEVTDQWLEWLRGELKNQMARWSEIAPSPRFGALPSLGKVEAHIKDYITLEPGRRPRFEVDREQILTLVRGANIYTNHFSCIRELLQNAVDATVLRLWAERWSSKPREELEKLKPSDLRKALKEFPIRVGFDRLESNDTSRKAKWRVFVEDKGTGISLDDVRHIQKIGSSAKNPARQRMIWEMPEWMRPSGIFGIGLQSVFLFTNKVVLRSRHHATQEALEVTLQNGQGSGLDGLSIKRLEGEAARIPVGTTVEFVLDLERVPEMRAIEVFALDSDTRSAFDPVVRRDFPHEIEFTRMVVREFSEACACPIELEGRHSQTITSEGLFDNAEFDPETNLEIIMEARLQSDGLGDRLYYRGAPVNGTDLSGGHPLLKLQCNVHAGRANELLLINRERFTKEGERIVRRNLNLAVNKFLPRYLEALRSKSPKTAELEAASLSAMLLEFEPSTVGTEWRRAQLIVHNDEPFSLEEFVSQERIDLHYAAGGSTLVFRAANSRVEILCGHDYWWLLIFLGKSFEHHGYHSHPAWSEGVYVFSRRIEDAGISEPGLRALLRGLPKRDSYFGLSNRLAIPCANAYQALSYAPGMHDEHFSHLARWYRPRMVCPFVLKDRRITLPNLDKVVQWTARNAAGGPRAESEVAQALWDFIREADALMAEDWKQGKAYDLERARFGLSRWLD